MSRCRAPSALRSPISRVRSRTLTSMMLETPTPPTSSEIAGDRGEHEGEQAEDAPDGAEDLGLGDRGELLAGVLLLQRRDQPALQRVDVVGGRRLDRERRRCARRRSSRCAAVTGMCTSSSRSTPNVEPTSLEDADDPEPHAGDGDLPAERVDVAEQVGRDGRTEHGDAPAGVDVGRGEVARPRASGRSKTLGTFSLVPLTVANASRAPTRTVSPDATVDRDPVAGRRPRGRAGRRRRASAG